MNKKQKLISLAGTVLIAVLLAAPAVAAGASALGLGSGGMLPAYLLSLLAALVCAGCAWSPRCALFSSLLAAAGVGLYVALNLSGGSFARLGEGISALRQGQDAAQALAPSAPLLAGAVSALFTLLVYVLVSEKSPFATIFAVAVCLGACVLCAATSAQVGVWMVIPCLLGACAAIAHTAEQRTSGGHIRALIPAALSVLIALALLPAPGATFAPLENAAEKLREIYEDYFSYTRQRVAFSLTEKGYDYYGLHNDEPTHLLGGPANPDDAPVMRVKTDSPLLLRGTVRGVYTGYSWEDSSLRSRNLYYDFTRRGRRSAAFLTSLVEKYADNPAFSPVSAEITLFDGASSTLFSLTRLTSLDMPLENAVYYNTAGELFLARNVEEGDAYSVAGLEAVSPAALSALSRNVSGADDTYDEIFSEYTALPEGVEQGVYQIAQGFTQSAETDAEKAQAILEGLQANCTYRLDVGYPPQDRDFVSYFLLESKEGYCSYFASAMAVLCRASGVPARYVEGYRVYPEAGGETLVTGESAHAWVEVYLKNVGWVAYDPTPGQGNASLADPAAPEAENTPEPTPAPDTGDVSEPTPSPQPETDPQSDPTPSPAPQDQPTSQPTSQPDPQPQTQPETRRSVGRWLWIVLIVLLVSLIAALMVWLVRKRLEKTDPIRLVARQKNPERGCMILYRSLLTLLLQMGHTPMSGETPEAFADRLSRSGLPNPDFVAFSREITLLRYARRGADRESIALGTRAYLRFRSLMKRSERLKFDLHRALKGLGDFNQIP